MCDVIMCCNNKIKMFSLNQIAHGGHKTPWKQLSVENRPKSGKNGPFRAGFSAGSDAKGSHERNNVKFSENCCKIW